MRYNPKKKSDSDNLNRGGKTAKRLNKYLSNAGLCSRREADQHIAMGLVSVNGKIVTEMGYQVNTGDEVKYDGQRVRASEPIYLLLNKPKGFVATAQGGFVKKSVQDLIRNAHPENVSPIGDMGRPITGLLFFTNDDALRKKLNNAQKKTAMVYQVVLDKSISAAKIEMLKSGIGLRGFVYQVKDVEYKKGGTKREIGIEAYNLTPGTLAKMLEKLEFEVLQMDRMLFAGLTKKDLPRGNWRKLTLKEVNFLQML